MNAEQVVALVAMLWLFIGVGFFGGYAIRAEEGLGWSAMIAVAWPIHVLIVLGWSLGTWVYDVRDASQSRIRRGAEG